MYSWYHTCCVLQVYIFIYKQKMAKNFIMHRLKAGAVRAGPHIIWTSDVSLFYNKLITDTEFYFHFNWKKLFSLSQENIFNAQLFLEKQDLAHFPWILVFPWAYCPLCTLYWQYIYIQMKKNIIIFILSLKKKKENPNSKTCSEEKQWSLSSHSFWSPNTFSEWKKPWAR